MNPKKNCNKSKEVKQSAWHATEKRDDKNIYEAHLGVYISFIWKMWL